MIGSLGDIVFEVSSDIVKTFDGLNMQHSARYAQHDIHGGKSLLEFTGLDPSTCSIKIRLDRSLGIDPQVELNTLKATMNAGNAVPFILDGEPKGEHLWVIDQLSEDHKTLDNRGGSVVIEVSISMKEYVEVGYGRV